MSDAILIEESVEFLDLLTSYVAGCTLLEEVEASAARERDVEEVQRQLAAARRQWRSALHRLGASPAYTAAGLLAKGSAIQGYLTEFPAEDIEAMALIGSIFADLQRLFGDAD